MEWATTTLAGTSVPGYGYDIAPAYGEASTPTSLPGHTADVCRFWDIFLAAALAGGAGIRATAPLFLLSAFHLMSPEEYPLSHEAQWLGHQGVCIALGLLLALEVLADQVPAVDHALHAVLTPAHPITGALAACAPNYCGGLATRVPMAFIGASTALSVHASKAILRGASTGTTGGLLNPCISVVETVACVLLMLACFAVPFLAVIVAVAFIVSTCSNAKRLLGWAEPSREMLPSDDSSEDGEKTQLREENQRLREQLRDHRQQAVSGFVSAQGPAAELQDPAE